MAQNKVPVSEVLQLRSEGLTDNLIAEELKKRGYSQQQISMAVVQADASFDSNMPGAYGSPAGFQPSNYPSAPSGYPSGFSSPTAPMPGPAPSSDESNLYERLEDTVESMIDEKWDELIGEVKKIVEWKEKFEETQAKLVSDIEKLKEDFRLLHQGVLGRLEDYDTRMRDVDTELQAVGKVFKDVVPEFVENVKELSDITKNVKKKKGE